MERNEMKSLSQKWSEIQPLSPRILFPQNLFFKSIQKGSYVFCTLLFVIYILAYAIGTCTKVPHSLKSWSAVPSSSILNIFHCPLTVYIYTVSGIWPLHTSLQWHFHTCVFCTSVNISRVNRSTVALKMTRNE